MLVGRKATFADVEALPYTRMRRPGGDAIVSAGVLMSRVALGRRSRSGSTRFAAGSVVTISPYVTHRNPRLWKDPLRFNPERFTPDRIKSRHRFTYLPFGGGPRICIGRGFAMAEEVPGARHVRPRLPPPYGAWTSGRSARQGYPSPALRSSHDARATLIGCRSTPMVEDEQLDTVHQFPGLRCTRASGWRFKRAHWHPVQLRRARRQVVKAADIPKQYRLPYTLRAV